MDCRFLIPKVDVANMVLTAAALQSRNIYLSRKCIGGATNAERGYINVMGRNMRFSHFLFSNISNVRFRWKHKCAEKLLTEVDSSRKTNILGRSKLLNKVSAWLGSDGLDDFLDHGKAKQESFNSSTNENEDSDISLACKRFPSITLGNSPTVNLYDGDTYSSWDDALLVEHLRQELLAKTTATNWDNEDGLYESLGTLYPKLAKDGSSVLNEVASASSSVSPPALNKEEGSRLESQFTAEESLDIESEVGVPQSATSIGPVLDTTINCIPGLSKKLSRQLDNCGFHTLRKLLHHFPRTYADMQNAHVGICDGQYMIFVGEILSSRGIRAGSSFSFLEVVVACGVAKDEPNSPYITDNFDNRKKKTIYLHLKQFFRGTRFTFKPFLQSIQGKYNEGDVVCVSGKVRAMGGEDHYEMREYHIDTLQDEEDSSIRADGKLYPIHPSKGALRASILRDVISRALKMFPINFDPIPRDITQEFGLPCLHDAYVGIHQPKNLEEADLARKRLIFDEFFYLQLGKLFRMLEGLGTELERDGLLDKYRKPEQNATFIGEWSSLTKSLLDALPYTLTPSQLSAVSEIIWDLKRPVPMNRLLQGDVGCGKTVVAFLACMEVIGCGYQAAFMVPTELLAVQHYEHFLDLLEKLEVDCKPSVALLTGSTPLKQTRSIRKGLQTGEISLVIGTHSLTGESVEFSALRIAIVDEQHRFGVIQRGLFNSKLYNNSMRPREDSSNSDDCKGTLHMAPHVLAMSATPIPRSLALALYGDISLTQITDLPPGRLPVETFSLEGCEAGFEKVYQMMLDELGTGGKVYLVYPVIDLSEQLPQLRAASADFETISSRFQGYSCGLLHGKMKSDEKDDALRQFRSGETNILLATQVIEIGVDVPDASMMVVMNAERFGLAQLHQLRGRVGRGERKSKCLLVSSTSSGLNRLKVLENSSDGFHLANMDLILRGPGDLLGKKQSGHIPEFPIARLEIDGSIIQDAHIATLKILGSSHDLQKFPALRAELSMRQPLSVLGD